MHKQRVASSEVFCADLSPRGGRRRARPRGGLGDAPAPGRVTALVGTIVFPASIVVSTILERLTNDVLIAGLGQGIVVIGWVALWAPAQYVVVDAVPHRRLRERYAEFADVDVRLAWEPAPL